MTQFNSYLTRSTISPNVQHKSTSSHHRTGMSSSADTFDCFFAVLPWHMPILDSQLSQRTPFSGVHFQETELYDAIVPILT